MSQAAVLYENDVYAWAMQTAQLLRTRILDDLDITHIAEEIESVGIREKKELESRLEVLIAHLLKLHFLNQLRAQNERGWRATIKEQRKKIAKCLKENPSLNSQLSDLIDDSYSSAINQIIEKLAVEESIFPNTRPYSISQILDDKFIPPLD